MVASKAGIVFKFPISEQEYAFGRVMLNIQTQCIDSKKIDSSNPLMTFTKTILVELYTATTSGSAPAKKEVLIPGILTSDDSLEKGLWEVIGFEEVHPEQVGFPEALSTEKALHGVLVKGELRLPLTLSFEEVETIGIFPETQPCIIFGELVLYQLGRKDEINNPRLVDKEFRNMKNYDLRFSEYRKKVYESGSLDPNESYYEMSKRMGFDLKRFYTAK